MENKKLPRSVDKAVEVLMDDLNNESKKKIKRMEKDDLINLHFGLGLYIRNNFIHGEDNEELLKSCGGKNIQRDKASKIILEAFWRKLQNEEIA